MHLSILFLWAFITTGAAADVASSLDFHVTTGSTGLQAQFTTDVRQDLHATVNWDAAGVTGNALVTVGPTTLTVNKTDGQPLRLDVAGLGVVSPFPLGESSSQHQLMAASAPFAAPSAGALVIEYSGAVATVATLTGFAIANVVLVGILWATCRLPRNAAIS